MPWLCPLIQFKPVPLCSRGFNWSNNGNSKRIHHCHEWEGPLSKPKYALLLTANGRHWLVLMTGCGTSCPPAIHQNWTPTVRHLWLNYETDEDRTNWIHKIWFPWEEAVECGWTYGGEGIHFIFFAQKKKTGNVWTLLTILIEIFKQSIGSLHNKLIWYTCQTEANTYQ